jgi:hypothetical protein
VIHFILFPTIYIVPGEGVNPEDVTLRTGRDGAGGQGDGVGIDHPTEVRLHGGSERNHDGADGELRVKDDPGHLDVGPKDLLDEPENVADNAPGKAEVEDVSILPVHPPCQIGDKEAGKHPKKEDQGLIMTGEYEPETKEGRTQEDVSSRSHPLRWDEISVEVQDFGREKLPI